MSEESPGRLFQDANFVVQGFENRRLEGLIGVLDRENPQSGPLLVYIKAENNSWQQFYLDMGIGFWENWGEIDLDDPSFLYIDYAKEFKVGYEIISAVYCRESCINIEFLSKIKIQLRYLDVSDFESDCELVKEHYQ